MLPTYQRVSLGDIVKFTCQSQFSVIWDLKNQMKRHSIQQYSLETYPGLNNHHLILYNVTCDHTGFYQCYGSNEDKVLIGTSTLDVIGKRAVVTQS